jgi:hypothetical protein
MMAQEGAESASAKHWGSTAPPQSFGGSGGLYASQPRSAPRSAAVLEQSWQQQDLSSGFGPDGTPSHTALSAGWGHWSALQKGCAGFWTVFLFIVLFAVLGLSAQTRCAVFTVGFRAAPCSLAAVCGTTGTLWEASITRTWQTVRRQRWLVCRHPLLR